jgi:hypothetical protein
MTTRKQQQQRSFEKNIVRQTELEETSWNIPLYQFAFKRIDLHFVSGS